MSSRAKKNEVGTTNQSAFALSDAAIESSINAIAFADLQGRLSYVNGAFLDMWGYKDKDEVLGKDAVKFWRTEREALQVKETVLIEGRWLGELVGKRKDGSSFDVQVLSNLIRDEKGQPACLMSSFVDVTEHKKLEAELRQSEQRYKQVVSTATDAIMMFDGETKKFIDVNEACEKLYGYTRKEFLNLSHMDITAERQASDESIKKTLEGKLRKVPIRYHKKKDGTVFPVEISASVFKLDGRDVLCGVVRDITERKQKEKALQESEEIYRTLVENISLAITLIDTKYKIIMTNDVGGYIFNKTHSDFVGKCCFREFEKRDSVCPHCPGTRAMATGRPAEVESEAVRDDGSHVPVRIQAFPVYEANGAVKGFIEVVEDITERKQAEEALRQSQEMYRSLFEGTAEGILVADVETKQFKYANPAICRMLGYTEEELRHLSVSDIHPKEALQHVISEFEAQARGEKTLALAIPCLRKDGTVLYADVNTADVVMDGTTCNVGMFTDITKRKRTEEELLFKTALLEAQSETSIDGILVVDNEGKSILFNERFGQMWKIPQHILNTRDDEEMLHCVLSQLENPSQFLERVRYLYAHKDEKSRDEIQFKDGRVFDRYSSPLLGSQGRYYGRIWYFRDITQQKRTEQQLGEARDELEARVCQRTSQLEKAVEKLQNEISERKKAEEKLLTYQEQLRSSASELSLAEERTRRQLAKDIHDHIGQNLAIANIQLQSLAKAADHRDQQRFKELQGLIAEAIERSRSLTFEISPPVLYELGFEPAVEWLLGKTRKQHGLITSFQTDGKEKPLDENVQVFLFQAVRELLINVAKHANARSVEVEVSRAKDETKVTVRDDGIGFNPASAKRRPQDEVGFGLFSIRERLSYIGGRLDIKSAPGGGSEVTVTAPLAGATAKEGG